jgi:hypothetical protein
MNHSFPLTELRNNSNKNSMIMHMKDHSPLQQHQVLPISRRRDILLSLSNESGSESSLDCCDDVPSPPPPPSMRHIIYDYRMHNDSESSLNTHREERRAYTVDLARKLRRMKRRLLLEQALVLARGPDTTTTQTVLEEERPQERGSTPASTTTTQFSSSTLKSNSHKASDLVPSGNYAAGYSEPKKINRFSTHAA